MSSISVIILYLLISASRFANVIGDGDHAHAHDDSATSTGAAGASVHTTTSDESGQQDSFSSILDGLSPELISSLAGNPQIAQALRSSGAGAAAAAKAAAETGGGLPPAGGASPGGYPGGLPGGFPGGLGGFGGGFPGGLGGFGGGFPFPGFGKNLHVSGDFGIYYPYIEKIIIVVGGGILILVILALLAKGFAKGGLLSTMGASLSEALAGSASIDLGPFHKSVAGAGAISAGGGVGNHRIGNSPQDMQLTQRVYDGLDQRF